MAKRSPLTEVCSPRHGLTVAPTLGILPVLAVSATMAGTAHAQDTVVDLDQVVIEGTDASTESETGYVLTDSTNNKVLTPIADTPKTISVVTEKEIKERGATSLSDILRYTPGITMRAGEGGTPAGDIPQIRGFDASDDILIDGIRNPSRTSYEAFNLETVEISKGSDGSTAGAGAEGGSINLTTKAPQPGDFNEVALSYGTGNFKRATIDMNRDFGAFGTRLNLMYQDADDLGGKEGKTSKRYGIAPSFSYSFENGTKVTAGLYYYRNEDMPDYGVRMSSADVPDEYRSGSGTSDDPWKPIDVPTGTFYGTPGRDFTKNTSASGYVRFDHDLTDSLRLSTTLRYTHDDTRYLVTQPGVTATGVTRGAKSSKRFNNTLAFNSQLTGSGELFGLNHTYAVGIDLSRSVAVTYGGYSFDPTPGEVSYSDPDLGYWTGTVTAGSKSGEHTVVTRSLYATDTVEFSPKWQASLGMSVNQYNVKSETSTGTARTNSDLFNFSLGVVYKPVPNGRFYASIGSSSRPGGLGAGTGGESASSTLSDLDPEKTYSYEVGTKWTAFNDQLLLTAAAFLTEKDNARVTNALGEVENMGKTRSRGIELGIAGKLTDKWSLSGGYVYQDAKLVDGGWSTPRGGGTPYLNPGNGKQLVKIPKNTFSLWTTYAYDEKWTFGAGATYVDKRVASYATDGSVAGMLPSSVQVDVMASHRFAENTILQLNVNNLFNEHVYGDSHVTQHVYTEPGRNYVLQLTHRF